MGIPNHPTCFQRNLYAGQEKKKETVITEHGMTVSELDNEYDMAVYCHSAHLTYMQSTSCEMPGLMNQKLESRLPGEISATICRYYHYNNRK